jgi:hypothetical protein
MEPLTKLKIAKSFPFLLGKSTHGTRKAAAGRWFLVSGSWHLMAGTDSPATAIF